MPVRRQERWTVGGFLILEMHQRSNKEELVSFSGTSEGADKQNDEVPLKEVFLCLVKSDSDPCLF